MGDMYHGGPPIPPHEYPQWAKYPRPGIPPKAYYITAYDIAVKYGFKGTEEEWVAATYGMDGLSAYQIFLKHNPDSTLTEEQWSAEVNAAMTAAQEAQAAAEKALTDTEAVKEQAQALVPLDYTRLVGQGLGLERKIAAITNGLRKRIVMGGVITTYTRLNAGEHPDLDDYWDDEYFLDFGASYAPQNTPTRITVDDVEYDLPGLFICTRAALGYAFQFWLPYDFLSGNTVHGQASHMCWQIWRRYRHPNGSEYAVSDWECLNGINPDDCDWLGGDSDG